ncbi:MAG: DAK2 domain-containing protein [Actinomycetota bacterium]|jgi:DAK2 domain fusion protein YloV|nr:DAK2 domain-containing protein [Actinomycetota bacterium]
MGETHQLRAADVRAAIIAYRDVLRTHQEVVNRLNVYPVPDGDTGTNMALTLESVVAEVEGLGPGEPELATLTKALAHGSLMGARGNSGVILSQLLRGLADEFAAAGGAVGPADLARALATADRLARSAVMRPVEGTILTVARAAAEAAATSATAGGSLGEVVDAARAGAADALARTPELLPVLADAGVVDAGGTGFLLFFDALASVVLGRPLPEPPDVEAAPLLPAGHGGEPAPGDLAGLRYEVMYLLEAPDETIGPFKEVWAGIGDSIVVVGGDGLWNCHIHTDDIGAAVEASLDAGRPRNIRVTDLLEQVEEERWVREGAHTAGTGPDDVPPGPPPTTAVVAVASGEGIKRIFRSLGVRSIIAGGQSMNPSTRDLLDAVEDAGSDEVVILPNNKNIRAVAETVAGLATRHVHVVPTSSVVEGFAALLAYDPAAHGGPNAAAMEASATRVVAGEVTRSVRDSDSTAGPIQTGDWLGLSRAGIEVVAGSLTEAACRLLDRLVTDEHELVTIIEGEGATTADTRHLTVWLGDNRPEVDVEVHHGGQPLYPYLFSIE